MRFRRLLTDALSACVIGWTVFTDENLRTYDGLFAKVRHFAKACVAPVCDEGLNIWKCYDMDFLEYIGLAVRRDCDRSLDPASVRLHHGYGVCFEYPKLLFGRLSDRENRNESHGGT